MKIKEGGGMGIQKLTKEQAVIISGFTGILCGEFSDFHADVEKRLGRGVQTFEFGFKEFATEVKKLYEADFIEMGTVDKEQAKTQAVPEGFVLVSAEQLSQWGHMANYAEQYGCPECFEARGYAHSLACEINAYFNVSEAQEPAND